mgnify:FL=1
MQRYLTIAASLVALGAAATEAATIGAIGAGLNPNSPPADRQQTTAAQVSDTFFTGDRRRDAEARADPVGDSVGLRVETNDFANARVEASLFDTYTIFTPAAGGASGQSAFSIAPVIEIDGELRADGFDSAGSATPIAAGTSSGGLAEIGLSAFSNTADLNAASNAALDPARTAFLTDVVGPFNVTLNNPRTAPLRPSIRPSFSISKVCGGERNPPCRDATGAVAPLRGAFNTGEFGFGYVLSARIFSDAPSASIEALTSATLAGLIALDADGDPLPAFIVDSGGAQVSLDAFEPTARVIPLPAGVWLMLGGFGALAALRRRGRAA